MVTLTAPTFTTRAAPARLCCNFRAKASPRNSFGYCGFLLQVILGNINFGISPFLTVRVSVRRDPTAIIRTPRVGRAEYRLLVVRLIIYSSTKHESGHCWHKPIILRGTNTTIVAKFMAAIIARVVFRRRTRCAIHSILISRTAYVTVSRIIIDTIRNISIDVHRFAVITATRYQNNGHNGYRWFPAFTHLSSYDLLASFHVNSF
ncbi:hypothetical protein BTN50_0212 [Candidatus Enterovibrio altilux]|uniref:Uncharacterized protein n=1 Tax=Candidatus Enterovibrio altilux TaxID=1927128 RepID=A0A291B6X5_9GAMM|nr:hypothetical protein BTN50_0212 [Candidatus Enterovibrio luxaltus]